MKYLFFLFFFVSTYGTYRNELSILIKITYS